MRRKKVETEDGEEADDGEEGGRGDESFEGGCWWLVLVKMFKKILTGEPAVISSALASSRRGQGAGCCMIFHTK